MKVLLISFSFPPAGGVGVLRATSLAKYLPENGLQVHVLTARNAPAVVRDESLLRQVPPSVTVHRTWTLDLPFGLRKALKKVLGGRSSGAPASPVSTAEAARPGKPNPLKTMVANLLLPDPQIGWLPFAAPAALRIVRQQQIDAVLITVPPFSSVKLAQRLRNEFPWLPIVLDFRDEWLNTTLDLVSLNSNSRAREVAERTEREAVEAATCVVAVTEAARDAMRARYPQEDPNKFRCISNGFDGPLPGPVPPAPPQPGQTVTLTYLGSVYGSTQPGTFVNAVLGLPTEARARLRVRFIGRFERESDRALVETLGPTVELTPFLPQAEALQRLASTDYVLLLSHDPVNVSAKLYDYLQSGKPILAAVHPGGDVRRRIEETRAGLWADIDDADAIRRMLLDAVNGTVEVHPDGAAIAQYHREPLTRRYAALVRRLVEQRG